MEIKLYVKQTFSEYSDSPIFIWIYSVISRWLQRNEHFNSLFRRAFK